MSILYLGNSTAQPQTFFYRGQDAAIGGPVLLPNTGNPGRIDVPAHSVAQTADMPIALINAIVAQLAPYGLGAWSGSGVGYSIDTPISLS